MLINHHNQISVSPLITFIQTLQSLTNTPIGSHIIWHISLICTFLFLSFFLFIVLHPLPNSKKEKGALIHIIFIFIFISKILFQKGFGNVKSLEEGLFGWCSSNCSHQTCNLQNPSHFRSSFGFCWCPSLLCFSMSFCYVVLHFLHCSCPFLLQLPLHIFYSSLTKTLNQLFFYCMDT